MARYIDADVLIEKMILGEYIFAETPFQKGVNANTEFWISEIKYMPTADVVPKSEVERLEKELADMLVSEYTDVSLSMERLYRIRTEHPIYKAIKTEIAREIFEEIERSIFGIVTPYQTLYCIPEGYLAELKKNYTESEDK